MSECSRSYIKTGDPSLITERQLFDAFNEVESQDFLARPRLRPTSCRVVKLRWERRRLD
jgi:hypothetical protein